ncbi:retrotransposon protein, putative, ty1-copia subclass, partial [Tanacetum coccineum]
NEVENQLGKKIKAIRSDRGGEYPSHEFVNHMKSCGIGYALETTALILNMVPTKKVDRTPYEIWHEKAPKLSYLRVWGYEALVKRDTPEKIHSRSIKCIFVGYPKETMGYYFYFPLENKIFVSQNAEFFENSFMVQEVSGSHKLLKMSGSDKGLELIQEGDTQPSKNTSEDTMRSRLSRSSPKVLEFLFVDLQRYLKYQIDMDTMLILRSMTRLVAKGFTQTYRVDYEKTFSLVANIRAIRILLAIAAFYDDEIWKMDVKTAFLNGHLREDVYMVQPEGFVDLKHPNKVCKCQRSICGLKQASRSWNKRFDEEIKKIGFTQNPDEPCVYIKASGSNVAFLVLYVDDILLMGNSITMLQEQNPGEIHWTAVKTILKYLRNTKDMVLVYGEKPKDELKVSCYADTSFQTDKDDIKSQTGYIAPAEASMEAVWMRKFIDGLRSVMPSNKRPMKMLCDNEPALAIASDPEIIKGSRHF